MNATLTTFRRLPDAVPLNVAESLDRLVRRRLNVAWGLLFLNTMTFVPGISIVHIPSRVGKGIAQGALPLALVVLLSINPKVKLRPNTFLCLFSLLIFDIVITSMLAGHLGTAYRTLRLIEFVAALWLLTPWWGRPDMLLLRCHLRWLWVALGSVLLGLVVGHGHAFAYDGRLVGVIWPMLPTQVAQYAGIAAGLTVVLWLSRLLSGRVTFVGVVLAVILLLLAHTRTALVGLVAGVLVAGLSLIASNARVRRFFVAGAVTASIAVVTVAGVATTWLLRGENAQGVASLTGRTNFWSLVLNTPRTPFQEVFGFGLSNASINGLPIDSNWLAAYQQEGLFGVVVCAIVLLFLFVAVFFHRPGVRRALALFLVTYCLLASITEDAFTDVSTYLLHLTAAASLLVVTAGAARGVAWSARGRPLTLWNEHATRGWRATSPPENNDGSPAGRSHSGSRLSPVRPGAESLERF